MNSTPSNPSSVESTSEAILEPCPDAAFRSANLRVNRLFPSLKRRNPCLNVQHGLTSIFGRCDD